VAHTTTCLENESDITKEIVVEYPVLGTGCPLRTFKEYLLVTG